jgi:hypothetical protein
MIGASERGDMYGLDFTMKSQPGGTGKQWALETEAYWTKAPGSSERRMGWFARLMMEVQKRWWITLGYDRSELPASTEDRSGYLAGLTYKVTEFHHWRLEWQKIKSSFESDVNVLTLQFQWVIGAHPAHRY